MNTEGTIYYVAPGGCDCAPGDMDHPWRTIQKAADTAEAGATVFVRGGTYREQVIHQKSGLPDKPIRFTAYPGETVTVDGTGIPVPANRGLWDFKERNYITVSGFHLENSQYVGFYADGSSYITIERNTIYKSACSGIGIWKSRHVIVDGNEVALSCSANDLQESLTIATTSDFDVRNNVVYNAAGYHKEGICLKDGSHDGKAYKNTVHDINGLGIYVDAEMTPTYNIEVYQNELYAIKSDGLSLATEAGGLLENVKVYNNLIYHNSGLGINIHYCLGEDQKPSPAIQPIRNVQIINNTLVENGENQWGGGLSVDNPQVENIIIRNNLISQNLKFQLVIGFKDLAHQVTFDHNLIDGFRGYEGEVHDLDRIEDSPPSAAGPHYHLTALSPAIDCGSMLNAPDTDFDGSTRPQGHGYDIGAYEYNP